MNNIPRKLNKLKKLKTFNIETMSQHPIKSQRPIPTPQGGSVLHAVASAVIGIKEINDNANKLHINIERVLL